MSVFTQWQPFVDGVYTCSGGRSAEGYDSTLVRLDTDDGIVGWGEMAPLGSFYDPSFAAGAREGLRILAPLALGLDPRHHSTLTAVVDHHMAGHPYAKSALDMAAWDAAGIAAGMPLAELLGGRDGDAVELYRSVAQASPAAMAEQATHYVSDGYRRIQVKVGLDPREDVERMEAVLDVLPAGTVVYADANAAWTAHDARVFVRATRHLDYVLEQPCADHDANVTVRAVCDRPFVLDESIDSLASLLRAHRAGLVDGVTLKIARLGGVTRTRLVRDVAVELGLQRDGRGHRWRPGRHGRDRPPVAQHAGERAHAHGRLPQLGLRVQRQRRSVMSRRQDERSHRPRARHHGRHRQPRRTALHRAMTAILTLDDVLDVATRMLRASGASPLQTDATARSIRDAEADGIRTVGLSYLPTYCDHVACGKVVGDAVPIVARPRPGTVVVDAGNGFCHPAFEAGLEPLVDAARACGVGVLAITHSYSAGVLGWFVERLAEQRLVALMFANSSSLMAPAGGVRPFFGTNPIAWAAPRREGPPVVADMSSSAVAWVRVNAAAQAGESIPLGWALDADGRPTTDSNAALAGSMAPAARPQGLGTGAARRSDVGWRGGLELLVRGVGLRRQRGWSSRRRPGRARHRPDGDDGRRLRRSHRARAADLVSRAGCAAAR